MDQNNYTAKSDTENTLSATNSLSELANNPIANLSSSVSGRLESSAEFANMAVKFGLAEVGMYRSLVWRGSYSSVEESPDYRGKLGEIPREQYMTPRTDEYSRYDANKDFYFRCGQYFMPLSIRFTLRAQKNLVESQLIDGPYIIERVSKAPKTIEVTIRLERKFDENPSPLHIVNEENLYNPVPDISAMINDLYEKRDVFQIENPILNGEHNVTHAVMREYEIIPGLGTTLMTITMSLLQVDIQANIINNEGNNTENGEILPEAQGIV